MRKGTGITGASVAHLSPAISGRLTLNTLHKMRKVMQEDQSFAVEGDNEFDQVKQLLSSKKSLKAKKEQIEKEKDEGKFTELELRK